MVHVITKRQLRYQESTNPRILRMAWTFPIITTIGGRSLLVDSRNSPNPGIHRNRRSASNRVKLLYKYDGFLDLFGEREGTRYIIDIRNDIEILIFEYFPYIVLYFSYIVILPFQFYGTIDSTCGIL